MLRDIAAEAIPGWSSRRSAPTTDQAGSATVDTLAALLSDVLTDIYPRLIGADRLLHTMVQLERLAASHVQRDSAASLDAIETEVATLLRNVAVYLRRISGHLNGAGQVDSVLAAGEALDQIKRALTGSSGVFASHRAALVASQAVEDGKAALSEVEADLERLVVEAEREAAALGERSRALSIAGRVTRSLVSWLPRLGLPR